MNSNHCDNKKIELYLGWKCVNDCVFCAEKNKREKFKNKTINLKKIKEILIKEKTAGANHVTFLGGEPSIQSNFLPAIKLAKDLGYVVCIATNGAGFASKVFCKKAEPFLDDIIVSVHGHNSSIHDRATRRQGSFKQLNQSLGNIKELNLRMLKVNTVINIFNYKYLMQIARFVKNYNIKMIGFSALEPPTKKRIKELKKVIGFTPRLKDIKPHLVRALEYCDKNKIEGRVTDIPFCCLGGHRAKLDNIYAVDRVKILEDNTRINMQSGPKRSSVKPNKCKGCKFYGLCRGYFEGYFYVFGDKEIKPIL